MARKTGDRVWETSTTTGTGTFALAGAKTGYRAYSAIVANNDTVPYFAVNGTTGEWETGIGTWTAGNNLARTVIIASSNAGAAVNFTAGTKDIFVTDVSARENNYIYSSPTISGGTLTLNLANGYVFYVSNTGSVTTLSFTNVPNIANEILTVVLFLVGNGTQQAWTWPASVRWAGGVAPTPTSTNGKIDQYCFQTLDGGAIWMGSIVGQNY